MGKFWGTLGLLCGLFGIFLNFLIIFVLPGLWDYWGLLLSGVGFIFSIVGIAADDSKAPGIFGLIFSIGGVIGAIIWVI
jgi:hypothetical protein